MFYDVKLLSVVNGRFGVVWVLGCHNRRSLTRKQIESVKVRQTCKEMQELVPISSHHASIHTLMTLQLGVVICLELQIDHLIRDIDVTIRRAKEMSVINLPNLDEISQVLRNIEQGDEVQKKAPKRPFTCSANLITLPDDSDINFTALDIFEPGFGQTEAVAGHDALSLLSGDIFSDLPDNLRTMENVEDMFPEAPGAPSRRRHEVDPALENFTQMEEPESEEPSSKKRRPDLPDFEPEEIREPENLTGLIDLDSVVDSGIPTSDVPAIALVVDPMEEELSPVNVEPIDRDVYEHQDLDVPMPDEVRIASPSSVRQEVDEDQAHDAPPVPQGVPPARGKPRKRVKIDKAPQIPLDQIQRNLENTEADRANLFVRPNPEAISGVNFLKSAGRDFLVNRFQSFFISGVDDIEPAFDENADAQDDVETMREANRLENQGEIADLIDNTHHFDPQSPGGDSRPRSELEAITDVDYEVEAQTIHQGLSVDQSGPPVLEPTMLSGEILPDINSPLRIETEEDLETEIAPFSESFVTERIMSALGEDEFEVCFQDIISESCTSRRQASSFFATLLNLAAEGRVTATQESFFGNITISKR